MGDKSSGHGVISPRQMSGVEGFWTGGDKYQVDATGPEQGGI